jgi:hypothetical protein
VPPLKAPNSVKIVISFMMVQIFLEGLICLNKIWTQPHDPYLSCLITGEDFLMIILIWQKQFNLYHWHTKFHENSGFFLSKQFIIIMWTGICIQKFQSIAYFFISFIGEIGIISYYGIIKLKMGIFNTNL